MVLVFSFLLVTYGYETMVLNDQLVRVCVWSLQMSRSLAGIRVVRDKCNSGDSQMF
jgi:hypothetical protein